MVVFISYRILCFLYSDGSVILYPNRFSTSREPYPHCFAYLIQSLNVWSSLSTSAVLLFSIINVTLAYRRPISHPYHGYVHSCQERLFKLNYSKVVMSITNLKSNNPTGVICNKIMLPFIIASRHQLKNIFNASGSSGRYPTSSTIRIRGRKYTLIRLSKRFSFICFPQIVDELCKRNENTNNPCPIASMAMATAKCVSRLQEGRETWHFCAFQWTSTTKVPV